MNIYIQSILHQLEVANSTIFHMIDQIDEDLLDIKPNENKRTIRELLAHTAVIYRADLLIMEGASQAEMLEFYQQNNPYTKEEIKEALNHNYQSFFKYLKSISDDELLTIQTSYWGVSYSRFEWIVEVVAHIYHHRGQLHTLLIQRNFEPNIPLFE